MTYIFTGSPKKNYPKNPASAIVNTVCVLSLIGIEIFC